MQRIVDEANRMPDAAIRFARGVSQVWTPAHVVPLREHVRTERRAELLAVHDAINERFGTTGATTDYVNVFYAASEMAMMAEVGREQLAMMAEVGRELLPASDRQLLRQLWDDLLSAT